MKAKKCAVCGEGTYVDMGIRDSTDLHNAGLGVSPIGSTGWRGMECDRCGNVQVFRIQLNDDQMRNGQW